MKQVHFLLLSILLAIVLGSFPHSVLGDNVANVVVLINRADPDSRAIAEYYVTRRQVPKENILEIDAPLGETIGLREYVDQVHNPVLELLLEKGWISGVKASDRDVYGRIRLSVAVHRIRFLVTTKGIPLRFENAPELINSGESNLPEQFLVNRGSVDSELALIAGPPNLSMTAFVLNPFFDRGFVSSPDANRVIRVSRLDGPSRAAVLRLIDRSIEAEQVGLMGRAYIDYGGPHPDGDSWFQEVGELAAEAFFDTDIDSSKELLGFGDRLDAPAIYMGWYREDAYGPWVEGRWPVPPGAIGFHLHSYSATSVRSLDDGWLGPLIERGFCATFGNVYEPYLEFTHRPQIFLKALLDGENFGDAVARANRALSWQTVAIGDPLYRPFKVGLSEQLTVKAQSPFLTYSAIRELNRISLMESPQKALSWGRSVFLENPTLPLAYRLAEIYNSLGDSKRAVEILGFVRFMDAFASDERILASRVADLLSANGEHETAFHVYRSLLSEKKMPDELRLMLLESGKEVAGLAGERRMVSRWSAEAQRIASSLLTK